MKVVIVKMTMNCHVVEVR